MSAGPIDPIGDLTAVDRAALWLIYEWTATCDDFLNEATRNYPQVSRAVLQTFWHGLDTAQWQLRHGGRREP